MGVVVNTVKSVDTDLGKGISQGTVSSDSLLGNGMTKLVDSVGFNLDQGSKICPVISECKDFGTGMA